MNIDTLTDEFLEISLKQLELIFGNLGLDIEIFLLIKNESLVGWELKSDNKEFPATAAEKEEILSGKALDMYIKFRSKLFNIPEICSHLKAARLSQNLTLSDVAKMFDRTRQEINRWENGVVAHNDMIQVIIDQILKYK